MTRKKRDIYIIHITLPNGDIYHYVGITDHGRIKERIAEHKRKPKVRYTYELAQQGGKFEYFIIHTNATTEDEKDYKWTPNQRAICPLCSPTSTPEELATPSQRQHMERQRRRRDYWRWRVKYLETLTSSGS